MNYKIDGRLVPYIFPIVEKDVIALSGVFDLPKRTGDTEYNWGTSIEPYVDAADISLDGRTLELRLAMCNYHTHLDEFRQLCINCRQLETGFGTFSVLVNEEIKVEEVNGEYALLTVRFWQQDVTLTALTVKPTGGSGYGIDGFNLAKDFGIQVAVLTDRSNTGKRLEAKTTLPYTQTAYRELPEVTLACTMCGPDLVELHRRMLQFQSLCAAPGLRSLTKDGEPLLNFYLKDGISVKPADETVLTFNLKLKTV